MKTLVFVLMIASGFCVLSAQTEDGRELGVTPEETVVQAEFDRTGNPTDANLEYHVVPPTYAGVNGGSTFIGPLAATQRTYQLLIRDSLLAPLLGKRLTAISWRLPASATSAWPTADVMYTSFDLYLSGSVTPANRSLTFAQNIVGVQTQVHNGSLTVVTGAYPFGGNPNDWGPEITFTPWLYTGGHLLIELRHTGFTGTSRSVDAISTSTPGYGTDFSGCWTGNYAGTSGSQGNFSVTRLTADTITVSVGENGLRAPQAFELYQNYPNPFNPVTSFQFTIPHSQSTVLKVYDVLGREVATLVNEVRQPGRHTVQWDAGNLAGGIYFYQLQAGDFVDVKKLVLVK